MNNSRLGIEPSSKPCTKQHRLLLHAATNLTNLFCQIITRDKLTSEEYLESSTASDIELFKEIANSFKFFLLFLKRSILDI